MTSKLSSIESSDLNNNTGGKKGVNSSLNSVTSSQLSTEKLLETDIEKNLVRIQKVAR